jgi:hypothetical protein
VPNKKSGTAGDVQSPADPTEAQDSLDGQAGANEEAQAAGTDRGAQTMSVSSVTAAAEQTADSSDALDEQ